MKAGSLKPLLVIFMKEPRPGRVKTRLARDLGATAAAWWYRHQSAAVIRRLDDPRWETSLAVAPDRTLRSAVWPVRAGRIPQGRGDLGQRMGRVLALRPERAVLIVGSDIPGLDAGAVHDAFRRLGGADVVLGPAEDGGYWGIGRRSGMTLPRACLADVRWSGPHALADTRRALRRWRIATGITLADVDTAADLNLPGPRR